MLQQPCLGTASENSLAVLSQLDASWEQQDLVVADGPVEGMYPSQFDVIVPLSGLFVLQVAESELHPSWEQQDFALHDGVAVEELLLSQHDLFGILRLSVVQVVELQLISSWEQQDFVCDDGSVKRVAPSKPGLFVLALQLFVSQATIVDKSSAVLKQFLPSSLELHDDELLVLDIQVVLATQEPSPSLWQHDLVFGSDRLAFECGETQVEEVDKDVIGFVVSRVMTGVIQSCEVTLSPRRLAAR